MSHLSTNAFPYITIRRVVIDKKEVTVDAFITTHDDDNSPFWLNEQVFSDYIRFYFILAPRRFNSPIESSMFYSPESRVDKVIEGFAPGGILQDMDSGINLVANRENWFSLIENVNLFSTKTLSLSEVIEINSDNIVTTSAIDLNSGNLQDINFTVTIPMSYGTRVDLRRSELELYAFSHLDVAKMIEDFSLDAHQQSISEMIKLGGNFKKELLLEIGPTGRIRVPETSTTLVYEDGTAYHGVYHYHDGDGPDGYTGYMEGPLSPMHEGARRLREIVVNYRKVIANFLIDDLLFTPENPFNGSADQISALDSNYNAPWSEERSFIDKAFSNSNLYAGSPNIIVPATDSTQMESSENLASIFDPANIETIREQYYNFLAERSDFSVIGNSLHFLEQLEGQDTSHNTSFTIYFEKMIKAKSKYAFLIENLTRMLSRSPIVDQETAFRVVMDLFIIKDLQIKRFRVSNSARSNNPIGTSDYNIYDTDEQEILIARGSEESGTFVQTYGLAGSTIGMTLQEHGRRKKIKLRDSDLAKNVNYGKYSYRIIMTIEDKLKTHLMKYINGLSNSIKALNSFVAEAHGGIRVESDPPTEDGDYIPNYDFIAKRYSSTFAQRSAAQHDDKISNAISVFVSMYELLGIVSEQDRSLLSTQLRKSIIPSQSGNLESAEKFLNLSQEILSIYRKIVATDGNNQVDSVVMDSSVDSYSGIGKKTPSNAALSYINVDKKIPGIAEAFTVGDVILSYGLSDLTTFEVTRTGYDPRNGIAPSSANIIAESAAYIELVNASQLTNDQTGVLQNNLQIVLDTPPELSLIQELEFDAPLEQANWGAGIEITNFDEDTFAVRPADINLDISDIKVDEDTFGLSQTNEQSLASVSDEYTNDGAWSANESRYADQRKQFNSSEIGFEISMAVKASSPSGGNPMRSNSAMLLIVDESSNNGGLIEMTPENIANQPDDKITVVAQNIGNQRTSNNVTEINRSQMTPSTPTSSRGEIPEAGSSPRGVPSSARTPNARSGMGRSGVGRRTVQRAGSSQQTPRNVGVGPSAPPGQSSLPRGPVGGGY